MTRAEYRRACEREYWKSLLEYTDGRICDAARISGLNPNTVHEALVDLGLRKKKPQYARRGAWQAPAPPKVSFATHR